MSEEEDEEMDEDGDGAPLPISKALASVPTSTVISTTTKPAAASTPSTVVGGKKPATVKLPIVKREASGPASGAPLPKKINGGKTLITKTKTGEIFISAMAKRIPMQARGPPPKA